MISAKITGLASLASELANLTKVARVAAAAKSHSVADEMVEGMRARVSVDSGDLHESIRKEDNFDGTVTVKAGGTPETARPTKGGAVYDEALLTEYGTEHQPAQPFFWPEVDRARERYGDSIIEGGGDNSE
jgi:HK97 gp10 family phage protein